MDKYTLDLTTKDVGEIIEMIRVQYLKLHAEPFARDMGMKEKVILTVEEGRGPHGFAILKKMNQKYKNIKIYLTVEID